MKFYVKRIKNNFPILSKIINGKKLVYLDNAACTQQPKYVIYSQKYFCKYKNSSVHRGNHFLSNAATDNMEIIRINIANFINALPEEIIFTKNTTEAINLIASSWGKYNLIKNSTILISKMEHHSNIIP